ncbi:hypothetical protein COM47_20505 [Bacillus wiedmannii]|nr:hypothetical protein CN889_22610 [Bacillus wiedmannii]PEU23926.1 hypothetical protein CN532_23390 [Bacillus wiedmannii]PGB70062.1 hypothetical protein COM12_06010 [Bacillus wiedmannii]PGD82302.1 hypothetical protein COM47_20505 [Bacillus wiedmannii]PHB12113.1 hypothetical protein COE84_13445 [Bacillus wiedmannii]
MNLLSPANPYKYVTKYEKFLKRLIKKRLAVANMIFNEKDDVAFLQFLVNSYGEISKDILPKNTVFFNVIKKET